MALFPELDEEKTRNNVDELLGIYRRLARLADEEYTPKVTASYSFELKSYTGTVNSALENSVIRKVSAEQEIYKIAKAMNKLNAFHRQMLHHRYMSRKEPTDIQIYMDLGMSERTYYRGLADAQIAFAEAYDGGRLLAEK